MRGVKWNIMNWLERKAVIPFWEKTNYFYIYLCDYCIDKMVWPHILYYIWYKNFDSSTIVVHTVGVFCNASAKTQSLQRCTN